MKNEKRLMAAAFLGTLLLDLGWRSHYFNFDGVACAAAVELSDFKHLVHGNHLAYGVLAWLFDRAWRLLGWRGEALLPLQILSALLGAAGAAVFASLLRRAGRSERDAALGAAALAVCRAWWFWSLEAQVYMLGALFAALAAREALAPRPRPAPLGLWGALAVLGHVGHVMAVPALAWAVSRARGRRGAAAFLGTGAALVLAAYAAAGLLAIRPQSLGELKLWLLGSAALGTGRTFLWHSASAGHALASWAAMTLKIFCAFPAGPAAARIAGIALAALALAAAAAGAAAAKDRRFWLAWLAGYAALYLCWEPFTIVYRVSDLLGLAALALAGLERLAPRARALGLAAWIAAAGAYNLAWAVRPAADPEANADLVEARAVAARVPEGAWIAAAGGRGEIYFPYFAHRRPLSLRYYPDTAALFARLDALAAAGEEVYATRRTLELGGRRSELARYGLEPAGGAGPLALYRVRRAASPAAGGGKN